jgi:phosphoserine phosphatase
LKPNGKDPAWRVVAVDLDGSIVRGTTTCLHLAETLGHRAVVEDLERRFASGELSNALVADQDGAHYKGRSRTEIAAVMASVPSIDDVDESVRLLAERGTEALLTTVTWTFAAECVRDRFGFAATCGTEMAEEGGELLGVVSRYCEPEDKQDFVKEYCGARQIPMSAVVAVGDARSDIPLFEAAGFSVALNATPAARAAGTIAVESDSLLDALSLVPGLLSDRS